MRFIGHFPVKFSAAAGLCGLFALVLIMSGCAGNAAVAPDTTSEAANGNLKQIHKLSVSEDEKGVYLSVEGSTDLLFSEIRKSSPPEVTFYFPGTQLKDLQAHYEVSRDPVSRIQTSEVVVDGHTAKIAVLLDREATYTVEEGEQGLKIAFSKDAVVQEEIVEEPLASAEPVADPAPISVAQAPVGTCIESVDYEERREGIDITVIADGTLKEYSAFTVDNPPRIVFDIFNISSPYKGLQKVAVDSKWVTGLRHFCYPDKLRLVLDTDRSYMTAFASKPIPNGLLISVSEEKPILREALIVPAVVEQVASDTPAAKEEPGQVTPKAKTAWLNKIEFTGAEGGESLVRIGTTATVRYDLQRVGDRKLQLKLFDTQVPQYRKRPLITTRFESAVDRVTPVQTAAMGKDAVVVFELREPVPYEVEQEENFILVRFAPSTIPPKPLETTAQAEWKQSLEGAAVRPSESGAVAEAMDDSTGGSAAVNGQPSAMSAEASSIKWGQAGDVLREEG